MKIKILILTLLLLTLLSCSKEKETPLSGIVTIDNILLGETPYYAYGFSFTLAKKVSSLDDPGPDITLVATLKIDGSIDALTLQNENPLGSFFLYGDYPDNPTAQQAFSSLTSATPGQWEDWANPVEAHQVWIFRTEGEKYAKFRIMSTVAEQRSGKPYAECTIEWVYQPDGSLTFPGK